MAQSETTPTNRGILDKWDTPDSKDDFKSPRVPRKASTRRPPLALTSPNTGRTPPGARTARESIRRLHIVDNDGDDSDCSLPEEASEDEKPTASRGRKRKAKVPAAKGVSSKTPKCGGGKPWAKKIKKLITIDTEEERTLEELVTDLVLGVAAGYDGRQMSDELTELVAEYAQSKADRPVEERSLFALTGKEGAQTTEQRLSVAMTKGKPELGRFVGDIEQSAPEGLYNVVSQVRAFARPAGAGMPFHRDSINLRLDRVVHTLLSGPSDKPPEFHMKLMSGPNATAERGPYGPDELHIPKENGRIMVKGPRARGEQVRVVHGVIGGDVESLTLVMDYYTVRTDGQATTDKDRDRARQSVVDRAESRVPSDGVTLNPFADRLVLAQDPPRTTGSRKGTEANNAIVWDDSARKWVSAASLKSRTATVEGVKVVVPKAVMEGSEAPTPPQQRVMDQLLKDRSRGGATLATGANQVGSAPSNGAAAVTRRAIPGAPDPARAHGFCFGFGADDEGLAEKLKQLFAGEDGYGDGPITEGGCNTPNFSETGVTKGKGLWQEDEKGYLIQGVHNSNATEGHPRYQIGGTVPVEKVNGSWRLCKWALPYVTTGKIVSRITHDQRFNSAYQKYRNNKRPRNCVPTV